MKTRKELFDVLNSRISKFDDQIDCFERYNHNKEFLLEFRENVDAIIDLWTDLAALVVTNSYQDDFLKSAPYDKQDEAKDMIKEDYQFFMAKAVDMEKWITIADKRLAAFDNLN